MKNTAILLAYIIGVFSIASCGSNDPNHLAEEAFTKEIWVIHDEVMPKTSEINRLQRQLKKLTQGQELAPDAPLLDVLARLEKAHDGMMQWMQEFKPPAKLRGSKSHDEIMAYLETEKQKITTVKEDMLGSIADGQTMLDSFTKAE